MVLGYCFTYFWGPGMGIYYMETILYPTSLLITSSDSLPEGSQASRFQVSGRVLSYLVHRLFQKPRLGFRASGVSLLQGASPAAVQVLKHENVLGGPDKSASFEPPSRYRTQKLSI